MAWTRKQSNNLNQNHLTACAPSGEQHCAPSGDTCYSDQGGNRNCVVHRFVYLNRPHIHLALLARVTYPTVDKRDKADHQQNHASNFHCSILSFPGHERPLAA
jgi:hypothetical protein